MVTTIHDGPGDNRARIERRTGSFFSKNNTTSGKQIAYDSERARAMINNLNKSTTQAIALMDNMLNGVGNLDDIWKGETKETFVKQLMDLDGLIKENIETIKELSNKIEQETATNEEVKNNDTKQGYQIYEPRNG
jgi:hypothetical protein